MNKDEMLEMRRRALHVRVLEGEAARQAVVDADLVYGFDSAVTDHWAIFFGKAKLQAIAERRAPGARLKTIGFIYDSRTKELEWFCAAVIRLKGSCDYESSEPGSRGSPDRN